MNFNLDARFKLLRKVKLFSIGNVLLILTIKLMLKWRLRLKIFRLNNDKQKNLIRNS